jgi:hypothetical protein
LGRGESPAKWQETPFNDLLADGVGKRHPAYARYAYAREDLGSSNGVQAI